MAAVLPSFDMESMVDDPASIASMKLYMKLALVLTGYFMFLEGVEVSGSGLAEYFSNIWNVMDWANFMLFFQVYMALIEMLDFSTRDAARKIYPATCGSTICDDFGFMDEWEVLRRMLPTIFAVCPSLPRRNCQTRQRLNMLPNRLAAGDEHGA